MARSAFDCPYGHGRLVLTGSTVTYRHSGAEYRLWGCQHCKHTVRERCATRKENGHG